MNDYECPQCAGKLMTLDSRAGAFTCARQHCWATVSLSGYIRIASALLDRPFERKAKYGESDFRDYVLPPTIVNRILALLHTTDNAAKKIAREKGLDLDKSRDDAMANELSLLSVFLRG
jgi:hypothetical protein